MTCLCSHWEVFPSTFSPLLHTTYTRLAGTEVTPILTSHLPIGTQDSQTPTLSIQLSQHSGGFELRSSHLLNKHFCSLSCLPRPSLPFWLLPCSKSCKTKQMIVLAEPDPSKPLACLHFLLGYKVPEEGSYLHCVPGPSWCQTHSKQV